MKILAIADRRPRTPIKEILRANPIDLICTLGDFTYFDIQELEDVTDIPKLGVYGNHCSGKYFESLGIKNMHLQTFQFQNLLFGGFQGCVRYKSAHDAIMYTQEEASELIKGLPKVDVLLCHCPPYGINDDPSEFSHTGFYATREYLDQYHPKFLFHGHTYPSEETLVREYNGTEIIWIT